MEYVYAALLVHKAGQPVTEPSVKKVLEAAGAKVDDARVKALVAALDGVNIEEAIQEAAVPVAAAPAQAAEATAAPAEEKKEAPKEEKKSEEQAAAGLGALFG